MTDPSGSTEPTHDADFGPARRSRVYDGFAADCCAGRDEPHNSTRRVSLELDLPPPRPA